jgi:hypothetical protein
MKNRNYIVWSALSITGILFMIAASCKKVDEKAVPVLSTASVSEITATSSVSGGNITSDGGSTIIERGVCWDTVQNPTIADGKSTDGSIGTGSFTANISGLTSNITYHVRAYANNGAGTGYGDEKIFITSATSDFVTTLPATNVEHASATLNGIVNANFLSTIVTFEYGPATNYDYSIAALQSPVTGNGNTPVSVSLTGLSATTTYHFRVKIVNASGTAYGSDMIFVTNYIIGDNAYGGIVFYCDSTGRHGLVCALTDQSTGTIWGCDGTAIGGTSTVLNSGAANTNAIVAGCTTPGIAAKICNDLVLNGYNDWYLPSRDELGLMYSNLHTQYKGNFAYAHYWSSSEVGGFEAGYASMLLFGSPMEMDMGNSGKSNLYYVRAVRAF